MNKEASCTDHLEIAIPIEEYDIMEDVSDEEIYFDEQDTYLDIGEFINEHNESLKMDLI